MLSQSNPTHLFHLISPKMACNPLSQNGYGGMYVKFRGVSVTSSSPLVLKLNVRGLLGRSPSSTTPFVCTVHSTGIHILDATAFKQFSECRRLRIQQSAEPRPQMHCLCLRSAHPVGQSLSWSNPDLLIALLQTITGLLGSAIMFAMSPARSFQIWRWQLLRPNEL